MNEGQASPCSRFGRSTGGPLAQATSSCAQADALTTWLLQIELLQQLQDADAMMAGDALQDARKGLRPN